MFICWVREQNQQNRFLFSFNREHFDGLPKIDQWLVSILQQSVDGDLHLTVGIVGDAVQPIVGEGAESSVGRVVVAALQGGPGPMTYLGWIGRERYQRKIFSFLGEISVADRESQNLAEVGQLLLRLDPLGREAGEAGVGLGGRGQQVCRGGGATLQQLRGYCGRL